jgi:negative regulator of replication initiation
MVTAGGGRLGDMWDSLLSGPEEEEKKLGKAKDPLTALNQHTKLLKEILDVLDNINDYIHFRDSNRQQGRKNERSGRSPASTSSRTKKLKKVTTSTPSAEKEHATNKKMLDTLTKEKSNLAKEIEEAKTPEEKAQLQDQSKLLDSEVSKLQEKVKKGEERGLDAKPAVKNQSAQVDPSKHRGREKDQNEALTNVLDKLGFGKSSKAIEKFSSTLQVAAKNLSKTFSDTTKTIKGKSKPLADAIKGSETAKLLRMLARMPSLTNLPRKFHRRTKSGRQNCRPLHHLHRLQHRRCNQPPSRKALR